jgi:hypothetical protein
MTSAENDLIANLALHKHSVSKAMAMAGESPSIDAQLKAANAVSNFDPVFLQILQTKLTKYQSDLNAAAVGATPIQHNLLANDFKGAQLLLSQVNSATTSLNQ